MKKLTCEMCGSTNLIKQDGLFVCQSCGSQYTVEEAKKMMVEGTVEVQGTVDVQGTVKVDNSDKIANYYEMAETAYDADNKSEAEAYCNKIIEIDPTNYKAWFLKGKAAGWQSTLKKLRIEEAVNCFSKAIDNASEDDLEEIKEEAAEEISSLSRALMSLCCNNFAKYPSQDNEKDILDNLKLSKLYSILLLKKCGVAPTEFYKKVATLMNEAVCAAWTDEITSDYQHSEHPSKYTWETFKNRCFSCINILKEAINLSNNDNESDIQRYKNLIVITQKLVDSCSYTYSSGGYYIPEWSLTKEAKELNINNIMEYHKKIKEIDPNYVVPERPSAEKKGGCYVATCVYGSYDCPEVWTLRRYRDDTLGSTWYGRAFIKLYYAVSPKLVKWFGKTKWFKKMWKGTLDRMVNNLQDKGVKSTPYQDKDWRK